MNPDPNNFGSGFFYKTNVSLFSSIGYLIFLNQLTALNNLYAILVEERYLYTVF